MLIKRHLVVLVNKIKRASKKNNKKDNKLPQISATKLSSIHKLGFIKAYISTKMAKKLNIHSALSL